MCDFFDRLLQVASLGTNVWLDIWTGNELGNSAEDKYRNLYLGIYGVFGFAQVRHIFIFSQLTCVLY